ncbi:serine protease [Quaeritorhiza haematococci]|nr:serine protease [Quaeritorhiza haematococci]
MNIKNILALLAVVAASSAVSAAPAPIFEDNLAEAPVNDELARIVGTQWIVKLKTASLAEARTTNHLGWLERELLKAAESNPNLGYKPSVLHRYQIGNGFVGYAARAPATLAQKVAAEFADVVDYVQMDGVARILQQADDEVQSQPQAWGLKRIAQRDLPLGENYIFPKEAGEGISVYVVDTGVETTHPQFEGRASFGANFANDNSNTDGNGHGTHCAGTIASQLYGVAKKANIVGVKVLGANGSGSFSGVIAGINWVAQNAVPGKSVASMSLGGGKNRAVDDAVNAAVAKNVPFAVAAGNSRGANACNASPAGATKAYTVAASDINDALATFSDVGPCVEIIAPGVDVLSTWIKNTTRSISGTSMATPHVAGVMAILLSQKSFATADDVYSAVTALGTKNKISRVPANTVNLLLFNGWDN